MRLHCALNPIPARSLTCVRVPLHSVAGFTYGTHQKNNGAYAEYTRYKADVTLPLPAGMSYEEGAAFPIPHFTAVQALYMRMGLPQPSKASTKKENVSRALEPDALFFVARVLIFSPPAIARSSSGAAQPP